MGAPTIWGSGLGVNYKLFDHHCQFHKFSQHNQQDFWYFWREKRTLDSAPPLYLFCKIVYVLNTNVKWNQKLYEFPKLCHKIGFRSQLVFSSSGVELDSNSSPIETVIRWRSTRGGFLWHGKYFKELEFQVHEHVVSRWHCRCWLGDDYLRSQFLSQYLLPMAHHK